MCTAVSGQNIGGGEGKKESKLCSEHSDSEVKARSHHRRDLGAST